MKTITLIFVVACLGVTFGRPTEDYLTWADKECINELNLSVEYVLDNFNDDWTATENNFDINKLTLCSYRKLHLVNSDDTLNAKKFKEYLVNEYFQLMNLELDNPEEDVQNAMDNCRSIEGSDKADTLLKHYNCVIHFVTSHV